MGSLLLNSIVQCCSRPTVSIPLVPSQASPLRPPAPPLPVRYEKALRFLDCAEAQTQQPGLSDRELKP